MLKNVVLPAPLGPMIDTIEPVGISIETPPTATSPPNSLTRLSARRIAGATGGRRESPGCRSRRSCRRLRQLGLPDALGELELASSLGQQPLRAQHHHEHEQEAEDRHLEVGEVEVQPELPGQAVEDVGDQVVVDVREQQRPSTAPQIDPRPPTMIIARMKIEKPKLNWSALMTVL